MVIRFYGKLGLKLSQILGADVACLYTCMQLDVCTPSACEFFMQVGTLLFYSLCSWVVCSQSLSLQEPSEALWGVMCKCAVEALNVESCSRLGASVGPLVLAACKHVVVHTVHQRTHVQGS